MEASTLSRERHEMTVANLTKEKGPRKGRHTPGDPRVITSI